MIAIYLAYSSLMLYTVKALYDYSATIPEEFDFQQGDIIAVTATPEDGWWSGELLDEARRVPGRHIFRATSYTCSSLVHALGLLSLTILALSLLTYLCLSRIHVRCLHSLSLDVMCRLDAAACFLYIFIDLLVVILYAHSCVIRCFLLLSLLRHMSQLSGCL